MIARIAIPLLLVIVLSDVYIDAHYFRKRIRLSWQQRLAWWIPTIFLVIYTCVLASIRNFAPSNLTWLNTYLFLLGAFVGPKTIFGICSLIGWIVRKTIIRTRRNYGHYVGVAVGSVALSAYMFGLTYGFSQIRVRHETLTVRNLPKSFDGYRIIHVSDLHVGSFKGWRRGILENEMDSIRSIKADQIMFTGDLQNMRPDEILLFAPLLKSSMKGTIAVAGNHDYAEYVDVTPEEEKKQVALFADIVRNKLGWTLLNNSHTVIRRGNDSIVIAGTENDGKPPFPQKADYKQTLKGVKPNAFVIMLQHDPSAWRRHILPQNLAQITLCGHTHAGQMEIFGFRPTQLKEKNDYGVYRSGDHILNVTAGLGGFAPFRLNMPNEIVVITLRAATTK